MGYTRSVQEFRMNIWKEPGAPRILIEGDSWADHPLVSNLSWCLHLHLRNKANILNISESGDLIYNMAHGKQFSRLTSYLKSNLFDFDMLFLSGGGNDILVNSEDAYKLDKILKKGKGNNIASYINTAVWKESLQRVMDSYRIILKTAQEVNPDLLVHAHNYDYIYPRNNGTDIIVIPDAIGPWVYPVMQALGITDQSIQKGITDFMLNGFDEGLKELKQQFSCFDYSNSLGTLPRHDSWGDNLPNWDDEIHPNSKGFAKIVDSRVGPDIKHRLNI